MKLFAPLLEAARLRLELEDHVTEHLSGPDARWMKHPTVAVDLDMTLTHEPYRDFVRIGDPAPHSQRVMRRFIQNGWRAIIYTCRPDANIVKAWADQHHSGVFCGINFNPDPSTMPGYVTPKPFASLYIDDKAWPLRGGPLDWLAVERDMEERGIFRPPNPWHELDRPGSL